MTKRVAITKTGKGEIEPAVRKAINLAGGLDEIIKGSSKVLIKPNLGKPAPSGSGILTNAQVTEAVTRMVMEIGPKSVIIGDGAIAGYDFAGFSTKEVFETSGMMEVAGRLGVELRNLNTDSFAEVTISHPHVMEKVKIAKTALESDVIISVPVLKSHIRTHVTLSLKNMKGVMPGAEKRKSHRLGLDLAIADLISAVRPHYAVIDATFGMEGLWQYPQDTRELGIVIAGRDPLAVDTVGTSVMGIDTDQVMHLQYIAKQEGTTVNLDQIEIVGEPLEDHIHHFVTGFEAFEKGLPEVNIIQGESACSGCTNELVSALIYMKEAGYRKELKDLCAIIGNPDNPKTSEKTAVFGKCAKGFSGLGEYAGGCPPKEKYMIRALCELCSADFEHVIATRDEARRNLWESSKNLLKQ
ncbi:MAG: DUF362 domain-containing protein [Pseudomonadota bacterium]